jgi:hypothetical protein
MIEILKKAEGIERTNYSQTLLRTFLEVHSELDSSKAVQAFILSWFICERVISLSWANFIDHKQIIGAGKKRLLNTRDWGASHMLEALQIGGSLSNSLYVRLTEARLLRNDVAHEMRDPSMDEARSAHQLARELIRTALEFDA